MNISESTVNNVTNLRIHWFGDPEDDETAAEARQVCSYFHTGNDIYLLANAADEEKHKRRARARAFRRTVALRTV